MVIPLMNIGEVAEIKIDPRFAYGSLGLKNDSEPELSIPAEAAVSIHLETRITYECLFMQLSLIQQITYEVHLIDSKYEDFADLKSFDIRKKYGQLYAQKYEKC